jgi:hypothetical protein
MSEAKDIFVSSLMPMEKGDVIDGEWPLHVTIVPWFKMPEEHEGAFSTSVTNLTHRIRPITIHGGEEKLFGEDNNIRVRTISSMGSLALLHNELVERITHFDGQIFSEWINGREGYAPHVSATSTDELKHCEQRTLTHLHRVRKEAGRKVVIASLPFLKNGGMV